MSSGELDVVGVGNAIVDVVARTDDEFLARHSLIKGAMRLIDEAEAQSLYKAMAPAQETSGGSAANTMAGVASLGGRPAYIGRVRRDQLGEIFCHDLRAIGVQLAVSAAGAGAPTARCLILVTPDAQRTMNTYLGACVDLGPEDIDEDLVRRGKVTYLEGYLWDRPRAKEAFLHAARVAASAGRQVALSLSDSFCVDRHRESFLELVSHHVDILFANEGEIKSLYQTDSFETAARRAREHTSLAVLTRGPRGSVLIAGAEQVEIAAQPLARVVDTTGAGDLYAAGVLFGMTHGESLAESGRRGAIAAAEVISHYGARPEARLAELTQRAPHPL
ncbi:MAG TPA: adenosine kinase [Polyangiaceae bacterium]|jgi:sugar/nucleoside kinase (ribokinase family)|nr:adenosine kinase [Polyangiaceae bacterium]